MITGQFVARRTDHSVKRRIRKPRSQAAVRSASVVMADRLPKNGAKVALGQRKQEVQTLSTDCADQALAEGVGLWNASRRLENHQTHRLEGAIDAFRVNRVPIVDHEPVPLVARLTHPKLLRRPV